MFIFNIQYFCQNIQHNRIVKRENIKENFSTQFYQNRIDELAVDLSKFLQRSRMWVAIRLLFFVLMVGYAYFMFPYNWLSGLGLLGMIILFLFFIRKSHENKEQLNFVKELILVNKEEIQASQFDFSAFGDGVEYKDAHHPFSYDMDIFGVGSFFQLFNRTVTKKGEKRLVDHLLNGTANRSTCVEAVDELSQNIQWNQEYLAYGRLFNKEETTVGIDEAIESYTLKKWIYVCRIIFPILAFAITFAFYFDIVTTFQFIVGIGLILASIRMFKTTNRVHKSIVRVGQRVSAMQHQLAIMEKQEFSSPLLVDYHKQLFLSEKNAQQGLKRLAKLIKEFEYRDNIIVSIILNFFLSWDFHLLIKFKEWTTDFERAAENWETIVYEMEALMSAANFRFNFCDETVVPTISSVDSSIVIEEVGHPLIPLENLVENSFTLTSPEQFAIITGPNMAGKSTFLRSIGVNLMLARAGFHTFAKQFTFPDLVLYSSMRTSDNLVQDTSYFHAELLRLRFIVDAIENGEKVFIILDEILKGTNSKDKEEGSAKFLQKLLQIGTKGIIATHDLSLTRLAKENNHIVNKYFDTKIEGDEISFDYHIREGIAQNMNASFLLKKMNLIG